VKKEPEFAPDWISKPGDALRALMLRRCLSPSQVAAQLPGGLSALRAVLVGSGPVDSAMASALACSVGGTASFWLKRQANYEAALERAVVRTDALEADNWLSLPVPGERPRGRLSEERRRTEIRRRMAFYNVGTFNAWQARYGRICSETLFRTSHAFSSDDGAVLMWLRAGEQGADLVETRPWDPGKLKDRLNDIRALSRVRHPHLFLPKLRALCAEAGVATVLKRTPSGCRASGACRMVAPDKAMILLSFRGLSDDRFWFTVFHEIGHLLLHHEDAFIDLDMEESDAREREANEFASHCIVPASREQEFKCLKPSKESILRFSVSVGVSPGLIVGQLQHRSIIGRDKLNYLKRHWNWEILQTLLD
jgi:plasmid maintenance system antidote protein VapI